MPSKKAASPISRNWVFNKADTYNVLITRQCILGPDKIGMAGETYNVTGTVAQEVCSHGLGVLEGASDYDDAKEEVLQKLASQEKSAKEVAAKDTKTSKS